MYSILCTAKACHAMHVCHSHYHWVFTCYSVTADKLHTLESNEESLDLAETLGKLEGTNW